ncbi:response regulator [Geminocystis sp. GBBB08]|uniref:response regulator n=1 Tax=Geminocystis sp. GBBB08 TaxID=2604140 RepID=UPI0027E2DE31|nr:response regulator [Geminocystis sp. GBBB08]MBL1210353.1 response regulator [Geminocystis sp. GBBB08]
MTAHVTIKEKIDKGVKILNEKKNSCLIYIVDDQPLNLDLVSIFLNNQGFNILTETDITKAIPEIGRICPDLILLDVLMPILNGFDACYLLKSSPKTKDIPIIFLTASQEEHHLIQAYKLGASDYVTKPFKKPELLIRVATQLILKNQTKRILELTEEIKILKNAKNSKKND